MRHALLAALAVATAVATPAAPGADVPHGRELYEARCGGCHGESVHGRAKREATDFAAVRRWVRRWQDNLGLQWSDDDIADVSAYLNGRYYRFPCPPADCQATGRNDTGRKVLALHGRTR